MILLQIYRLVCQRKKFENTLTFGEVMGKSLMSCFLTHCVVTVAVFKSRLKTFLFSRAFCLHSSRYHTAWPQRL